MGAVRRAREVALVDLYPVFAQAGSQGPVRRRFFFRGDVHWNEASHALVAEQAARALAERPGSR